MAHGQANAEILEDQCPTLNCNHEQPIMIGSALSSPLSSEKMASAQNVEKRMENANALDHTLKKMTENHTSSEKLMESSMLVPHAFKVRGGCEGGGKGYLGSDDTAFTVATHQDQQIAQPVAFRDPCPTLTAKMQGSSGWAPANEDAHLVGVTVATHQNQQIAQPLPFDTTQVTSPAKYSSPKPGDPCHPLAAGAHIPAVAFAQNTRDEVRLQNGDGQIAGALAAEPGMKQTTYVAQPVAFVDVGATLKGGSGERGYPDPSDGNGHNIVAQPVAFDAYNFATNEKVCASISTDVHHNRNMAAVAMQVRRLTPVECERLQGFPDNHTNIPWRGKAEAPDGPRYKALGNSMAVPVMRWIGERINA